MAAFVYFESRVASARNAERLENYMDQVLVKELVRTDVMKRLFIQTL
jgi:hypothetical protein